MHLFRENATFCILTTASRRNPMGSKASFVPLNGPPSNTALPLPRHHSSSFQSKPSLPSLPSSHQSRTSSLRRCFGQISSSLVPGSPSPGLMGQARVTASCMAPWPSQLCAGPHTHPSSLITAPPLRGISRHNCRSHLFWLQLLETDRSDPLSHPRCKSHRAHGPLPDQPTNHP